MSPLPTADKLHLAFFILFIPTMIFVDLLPLWPQSIVPQPLHALNKFYLSTFNDQLMIKSPPWFTTFAYLEAFYNLPVAIWLVFAILRRDPRATAHTLVYATVCTLTSWTCIVEVIHEPDMTPAQKKMVVGCYLPFCFIFPVMAMNSFLKIQERMVTGAAGVGDEKKRR